MIKNPHLLAHQYIAKNNCDHNNLKEQYGIGVSLSEMEFGYQFGYKCAEEVVAAIKASKNPKQTLQDKLQPFCEGVLKLNDSEFIFSLSFLKSGLIKNIPSFSSYNTLKPEINQIILTSIQENKNCTVSKNSSNKLIFINKELKSHSTKNKLTNKKEIQEWLDKNTYKSSREFTINDDLTVDAVGNVIIQNVDNIPFQFNRVKGDFEITRRSFTSLEGCPKYVTGEYNCQYNYLETFEHGPLEVKNFKASNNYIKNLTHLEAKMNLLDVRFNPLENIVCNFEVKPEFKFVFQQTNEEKIPELASLYDDTLSVHLNASEFNSLLLNFSLESKLGHKANIIKHRKI